MFFVTEEIIAPIAVGRHNQDIAFMGRTFIEGKERDPCHFANYCDSLGWDIPFDSLKNLNLSWQ